MFVRCESRRVPRLPKVGHRRNYYRAVPVYAEMVIIIRTFDERAGHQSVECGCDAYWRDAFLAADRNAVLLNLLG